MPDGRAWRWGCSVRTRLKGVPAYPDAGASTRDPLGMPLDVYRSNDGSYHVEADLPGVDPDSIEVTVDSGALTIQAERPRPTPMANRSLTPSDPRGRFARKLSLGEGVDSETSLPTTPTASCT